MNDINQRDDEPKPLSKNAFDAILAMIMRGELAGGEVVSDRKLSEQLGLSRTPVREALGKLESQSVLRRSGRVMFVNQVDVGGVLEVLSVRKLLEAESARLAAGRMAPAKWQPIEAALNALSEDGSVDPESHWRMDDMVHLSIAEASGNELLRSLIKDLRTRTRMFGHERIPSRLGPGRDEHLGILRAIAEGDAAAAAERMAAHIDNARQSILRAVTGKGE